MLVWAPPGGQGQHGAEDAGGRISPHSSSQANRGAPKRLNDDIVGQEEISLEEYEALLAAAEANRAREVGLYPPYRRNRYAYVSVLPTLCRPRLHSLCSIPLALQNKHALSFRSALRKSPTDFVPVAPPSHYLPYASS